MALAMLWTRIDKKQLIRLNRNVLGLLGRHQSTEATVSENAEVQSTETKRLEYPPILDMSKKAKLLREEIAWHEEVKKLNTIEEKLIKVNMPKYYGWRAIVLNDKSIPFNALPYIKQYTRTQFEEGLPKEWCKHSPEQLDAMVNDVKKHIEDALVHHHRGFTPKWELSEYSEDYTETEKNRLNSFRICADINRALTLGLMQSFKHLYETKIDIEPRHEAFWFVGGIEPTYTEQKRRKKLVDSKTPKEQENLKDYVLEPVDRPFQYEGKPLLALRNRLPLEPVIDDMFAPAFTTENLPHSSVDPWTVGYTHEYQHGTSIPGFWPGSEHLFGQLSYHDRSHFVTRNKDFGKEDDQEALHTQAIMASYSWLLAQACYQGFSTYNDITYPLTTQTIITDGQTFSFYVYQMNTTTLNNVVYTTNPKVNKCWGTAEMKLFESIDADGKIVGLNDDVIRNLVQFYAATPKKRDYNMTPYLNPEESTVADIEHDERRVFLEEAFKHIYSKRPRARLVPEIYMWEKIYKIDNETRPMDARRRPFELNQDPWARRLDEHQPRYIPKALRPGGPRSKKKWENTYWP